MGLGGMGEYSSLSKCLYFATVCQASISNLGHHPGGRRVQTLLTRALSDRAWRRRSWLVILLSRASRATTAGEDDGRGKSVWSGRMGKRKVTTIRAGSGVDDGDQSLRDVVTSLLALVFGGLFLTVVCLL